MDIFTLLGKMVLEGQDKVNKQLKDMEGFLTKNKNALRAAGVAMGALGTAGLLMVDKSKEWNAQLAQTGITLGLTTGEMRKMVLETTNVTFGIKSAIATIDLLTRAGVRDTEVLKANANAFDALADATGSEAEVVADILLPAYKSLGERIPQTSKEMDRFTWLVKNTTIDLADFGSVMQYVAMYGQGLNITIDQMIAIMAALEARGITGAAATRLFRTAVNQAKEGTISLNEALGVTKEQIDFYIGKIGDATGLTEQYADAANTQYTIMDKLKQKMDELTLSLSSFLEPLEPIIAAMTALGPVVIFLTTSSGLYLANLVRQVAIHPILAAQLLGLKIATIAAIVATKAAAAAQWLWNAALLANPIGLIIAAIAGLIAAGIALWKNWDKIVNWFKGDAIAAQKVWEDLQAKVKAASQEMIADMEAATQKGIDGARRVAEAEKAKLQERADYWRDFANQRQEIIDEQTLAELQAYAPYYAETWKGFNQEIKLINERSEARKKARDEQHIRDLSAQLEGENLSRAERKRLEQDLEEAEDTLRKEEILQTENADAARLNIANLLDAQINAQDTWLQNQITHYNSDLEAFKKLNLDKLADVQAFVQQYNTIMDELGGTKSQNIVSPGAPSTTTTTPLGPVPPPAPAKPWYQFWQHGGMITEPSLIYGLRSMKPYAIAGEHGPEPVGAAAGTNITNTFHISQLIVREQADIERIALELYRLQERKARRAGV